MWEGEGWEGEERVTPEQHGFVGFQPQQSATCRNAPHQPLPSTSHFLSLPTTYRSLAPAWVDR